MKAVSHNIVRWLPHLRRHAHALNGTRERGDAYVMACLSVIVTEPERLQADGGGRLGLFRLFHTIWTMIASEYPLTEADPVIDELTLCQGLAELPPLSRQTLLLTSMEGFSTQDTAAITGVPEAEVVETLAAARAQIHGRLEYLIPLDVYRQARPRRSLQRPARRPAPPTARPLEAPKTLKPRTGRVWSTWTT